MAQARIPGGAVGDAPFVNIVMRPGGAANCGPDCVKLWVLHSFQRGRLGVQSGPRGCVLRVSGNTAGRSDCGCVDSVGALMPGAAAGLYR